MDHAQRIANWISIALDRKYQAGQREHGGNLRHKAVMPHIIEEIVDTVVYVSVLQEQHALTTAILELGISADNPKEYLTAALNILNTGNLYGDTEVELDKEPTTPMYTNINPQEIAEEILAWLN